MKYTRLHISARPRSQLRVDQVWLRHSPSCSPLRSCDAATTLHTMAKSSLVRSPTGSAGTTAVHVSPATYPIARFQSCFQSLMDGISAASVRQVGILLFFVREES